MTVTTRTSIFHHHAVRPAINTSMLNCHLQRRHTPSRTPNTMPTHRLHRSITHIVSKPIIHTTAGRSNRSSFDPNPDSDGALVGEVVLTTRHGVDVMLDPMLNKGTGYSINERERLGIRGLVPPKSFGDSQHALDSGVKRVIDRFNDFKSPISQYVYLVSLQDRNETLFYRILIDHIATMAPIVYTPTVGVACQNFGTIFRKPRGMYFTAEDRHCMHSMIYNWPHDDVELIVVTDGSRILGLGDLGANGMGIPIGKLSLYSAAAGIHPCHTLPCLIDVGTNNQSLLDDDHSYLGLQHRRLTGDDYMTLVDEFMHAVTERYPRVLIQFEDFENSVAAKLLNKYKDKYLCFNDDIQGTGAVATAGILTALRALGSKNAENELTKQRIVICGAGSAGLGVANAVKQSMIHAGMTEEQALKQFYIVDVHGALGKGRTDLQPEQEQWAHSDIPDKVQLAELMDLVKPTILIGLTGVGKLFTEKAVRAMAKHCERPLIFPLSNPTDRAECTAEEAYTWTNGKCIFASGSPFEPVKLNGKLHRPGQSNNFFTFPGIGLGAIVIHARAITDSMLYAASKALADFVTDDAISAGYIFPKVEDIRHIAKAVGLAVAKAGFAEGVEQVEMPSSDAELIELIEKKMWDPKYGQIVRVNNI